MNLYLIGHDYRYAAEQMLLTLFPDERPVYPDGRPTGDRAELRLMSGPKITTVTCVLVYQGRTANGRTSVPNSELTDPNETARRLQGAVKRAFYRAAMGIGLPHKPWGMLTGVRPGKLMTPLLAQGMTDEQAARCLRQDPQDRGRGHAIGEKLTHECAEKTDEQAADRTVEHRAHDDGQRRDGDVDPAKAHRTGKVQHNVNCGQHGDGDHFARGHGRGLPREDHRGDEHEGDRDDDRPHDGGKRFDLKGHCEDLLFHQKIFPRLRRRAERLDPVKKKTPLPPDGRNHAEERPHLNSLLSGKRMRKPYCKPWVFRPRATSHPDGTIRSSRKHMASYSADA